MSNLYKIYKDNEDTFYCYSSGVKRNTVFRKILQLVLAVFISSTFFGFSANFINGIIAVYSILSGFGLNILFFLMSADKNLLSEISCSIEDELRVEKVNKLSKELFYNISYFIMLCIIMILLCLLYYLLEIKNVWLFEFIKKTILSISKVDIFNHKILQNVIFYLKFVYDIALTFFLFEGIYSFCRTVFRVCFLFDKKLELK